MASIESHPLERPITLRALRGSRAGGDTHRLAPGHKVQLRPFTVITELLLTVISNSYKLLITVILTVISRDLTSYKSYL